ncbi:MAG: type I glyceraldehyde-3-phosphate dehydrogenase [Anaerolineaceae bacterium]|nr:type I glyceraldehyde-3-phosphate dehydrogenase [Anaerolineaceae bacterium]
MNQKTTRVGINGFGRIGRQSLKAILKRYPSEIEVVAVNDLGDLHTMTHLFRYDSTYGPFAGVVEEKEDELIIDGKAICFCAERNPAALPWDELGVEIVIESTGIFRDRESAAQHLAAGARKVLITAPAKNEDITICLGVNEEMYQPDAHHIISNASCTTNCLAPPARVLHDHFGIERGVMTTIHSYTSDQQLLDLPHSDLRRARSAAENIIPTSTGAAQAVALVIPELQGRFTGMAVRVPSPTVSLVDFVAILERPTDTEEMLAALQEAADGRMAGVLSVTHEPLVSNDFRGNPHSSIVDAPSTQVVDGKIAKIITWYDNEWGYACRVADLVRYIGASQR